MESMPRRASRCERSRPAGPAPTIPTSVREVTVISSQRLEGIGRDVTADGHPAGIGERLQVSDPAEPGAGAGGADPAERDVRLVVHGLLVDVHDPGGYPPGQVEAPHYVPGQDA